MEEKLPRAGETKPGGSNVIAKYLTSFDAPPEKIMSRNPIPPIKKEQRNTVLAPTVCWYRSARRKNSPKTSPIRLLPGRINSIGIRPQNGSTVTTRHLFWPNRPRSAAFLLPIWLRNPCFLGRSYEEKATWVSWGPWRPPGGVSGVLSSQKSYTDKAARNFLDKWRGP